MSDQALKPAKIRIFIDFWNFSLSLRRLDDEFKLDWTKVSAVLTRETATVLPEGQALVFEAMHVYGSFDPAKSADAKFRNWFTTWLDRQPGTHTVLVERQRKKNHPKCPKCQGEISNCPACNEDMRGTEEKGVDTRIVTDMISLAWSNGYEVAVIVSSDRDFVPVADFLQGRGIKVIHAAFPPVGSQLSQRCWGSFSVPNVMNEFRMPPRA